MTPRNAAEITFSGLGAYLIAASVPGALEHIVLAAWGSGSSPIAHTVGIFGGMAGVVAGAAVLLLRKWLAARLISQPEPNDEGDAIRAVHAAAISVVGIFFLGAGVSGLANNAVILASGQRYLPEWWGQALVQTTIGLAFFFGANGIVGLWRTLRRAGLAGSSNTETSAQ